ncbi:MAG: hypothetical protein MK212_16965 [Saprospiraceae bacterium]|nr:hypothetical protein [Saprospiraceae bacterium]
MKVLVVNNHGISVNRLIRIIEKSNAVTEVQLVDEEAVHPDQATEFDRIILSSGAGMPIYHPQAIKLIHRAATSKPILGLGFGALLIGHAFGANLQQYKLPVLGQTRKIIVHNSKNRLLKGLPREIEMTCYQALTLSPALSPNLIAHAKDVHGTPMLICHKKFDICGLLFDPCSGTSPLGMRMLSNWLEA